MLGTPGIFFIVFIKLFIIKAAKCLTYGLVSLPVAMGAISTGLLFSSLTVATARNPEEHEKLFSNTLVGFALIETFVFIGITLAIIAHLTF